MATDASKSLTSVTTSAGIPVNLHGTGNGPIMVILDFTTGTGVGTASAQFTTDGTNWFTMANLSGKSATTYDVFTGPCRQIRLNVTAYTSGTIYLRVLQGDYN